MDNTRDDIGHQEEKMGRDMDRDELTRGHESNDVRTPEPESDQGQDLQDLQSEGNLGNERNRKRPDQDRG